MERLDTFIYLIDTSERVYTINCGTDRSGDGVGSWCNEFYDVERIKGFSLVETILAMTILGIAATSIMATHFPPLVSGSLSHDYAIASILLDDLRSYVRTNMLTPEPLMKEHLPTFPNMAGR